MRPRSELARASDLLPAESVRFCEASPPAVGGPYGHLERPGRADLVAGPPLFPQGGAAHSTGRFLLQSPAVGARRAAGQIGCVARLAECVPCRGSISRRPCTTQGGSCGDSRVVQRILIQEETRC